LKMMFTTNPGVEDVAAEEVKARLSAEVLEVRSGYGRVVAEVPGEMLEYVHELRSIHRPVILLAEGEVCSESRCLRDIYEIVRGSGVERFVTPWTPFAVRAERAGEHEYTSLDIARVSGDAVIDAVRSTYGLRPPVDLDYPSIIVSVDVIGSRATVGIDLGGDISWHRRGYRVYDHPAALKPTLAYAMLWLSGARDGDVILDPMCGGGTIAIEAALLFENSHIICLDKNPRHIRGAMENAAAAGVAGRIEFIVGDARRLSRYVKEAHVLVSNPPYGIRLGSPREVRRLYEEFIAEAVGVVRKSITLITTEYEYVRKLIVRSGWNVVHERRVAHGNLFPHIIVAKP
jgi:tRNA (guanine6-N2)-methyltransferase